VEIISIGEDAALIDVTSTFIARAPKNQVSLIRDDELLGVGLSFPGFQTPYTLQAMKVVHLAGVQLRELWIINA